MSFRHVEAFRTVMLAGSMTEAARRLHTSQPQVSRLIAQLEAITGLMLFDRHGSRLSPTVEAERFHHEVERACVGLASLEAAAADIRLFGAGRLSVAAMPRLAGGLLARSVARFKHENPGVMVSLHAGDEGTVYKWIAEGSCDAGLTMLYGAEQPGVQAEPVLSLDCVAVLPRGHRLARQAVLGPADLDGEPFIASPVGNPLRVQIDAVLDTAGIRRPVAAEAGLGSAVCALVAAGLGISLMNPLAAYEEAKVSPIEIRRFAPALPVVFALVFPPLRPPGRLVAAFSACARAVLLSELAVLQPDPAGSR
ncbi:transcriptional regulator [Methylobacterium tarhaniae]|uniref:Transcriptional regulator n=1 Tax=Methylobacterium tarhaniae TaxID=1187852 RepID=A0A0J6SSK5_9HYPH|nr:LysR substrate-binding domain-containing protein [Methylobacterium tarhaniae]KMO38240.1 transcriptional regulator [Methylobacterium tarhaniae]